MCQILDFVDKICKYHLFSGRHNFILGTSIAVLYRVFMTVSFSKYISVYYQKRVTKAIRLKAHLAVSLSPRHWLHRSGLCLSGPVGWATCMGPVEPACPCESAPLGAVSFPGQVEKLSPGYTAILFLLLFGRSICCSVTVRLFAASAAHQCPSLSQAHWLPSIK